MKATFTHPFSMMSITLSFTMHNSTPPVAAWTYRLLFFAVLNRGEHLLTSFHYNSVYMHASICLFFAQETRVHTSVCEKSQSLKSTKLNYMLFVCISMEGGKRPENVAQSPLMILEPSAHTKIFHEYLFSVFKRLQKKCNVKVLLSLLPGVRKSISLKVSRFRPLLILLRKVLRRRRVWSIVEMKMTAKIWRSGRKNCFSVILSTRSLTLTVPRSIPGLRDLKTKIHLNYVYLLLSSKVTGEI
jgi:hypothetical protein